MTTPDDSRAESDLLVSGRFPYRAVIPDGWFYDEVADPGDIADAYGDGTQVILVRLSPSFGGAVFQQVFEDHRSAGRTIDAEPIAVRDAVGRLYRVRERRMLRKDLRMLDAVIPHGDYWAWRLTLIRDDGRDPDEAVLRRFVESFEPSPITLARDDTSGNIWALAPGDCFKSLPLVAPPGTTDMFIGGVDDFHKVRCDEPHTGQVLAVWDEVPPETTVTLEDKQASREFGFLVCVPAEDEPHPESVAAVLVAVHSNGVWTGSLTDEPIGDGAT